MMASCTLQLLSNVLAGAKSALKDEANTIKIAKFIEAEAQILDCSRRAGYRSCFDRVKGSRRPKAFKAVRTPRHLRERTT
jgi:hypothetical protein